ncbi:MAG: UvrD-helicase domain-containing protein [Pseudoalteromonas distincta]
MISLADKLLQDRPEVLKELSSRIDCMVVDEFQDTNPQQFSLLWRLKQAGVPALVVGDLKQAIMGFQGADPRLLSALIDQNKTHASPLSENWRSQPALMHIINKLGPGLFGDAYGVLEPKADDSALSPLEIIEYEKRPKKDYHSVRAAWVGERVRDILDDASVQVIDRKTKELRGIQGRDLAILCQTHKALEQYAQVLRAQGRKVRLEEAGWFESRPVQLAFYALSYVANPGDRHSELYMATTELGSATLEEGIRQLIEQGGIRDSVLDSLDTVREGDVTRNVYAMVADTLTALSFYDVVSHWPDATQARASLLRLQSEAEEFMTSNREARSSGGFYGDGLPSFLAWLSVKVTGKEKNHKPTPRVQDEDTIELVTWHASKGREWPIVIVGEMDRKIEPRLPDLGLGFDGFSDLGTLLDRASIEYSPTFAAPEATESFATGLQAEAELEARRLLYVALTRAREKLIIEWPSYALSGKGITPLGILKSACEIELSGRQLKVGEEIIEVEHFLGAQELPGDLELSESASSSGLSSIGRRAIIPGLDELITTPDGVSPSSLEKVASEAPDAQVLNYAPALEIEAKYAGAEFGTLVHRFFEMGNTPESIRQRLAETARAEGLTSELVDNLLKRVECFDNWLIDQYSPSSIHRELPIIALTDEGSVMNGLIDVVLETEDGCWVIDHKSDQIEDSLAAFNGYQAQLAAYKDALEKSGKRVLGTAIHWIRNGELVMQRT